MKVISNVGCTRCVQTKALLKAKNIEFEEYMIEDLSKEDQERYKEASIKAGLMQFPLIIDNNDNVISLAEALMYKEIHVVKRNGSIVSFDKKRIVNAINAAINETDLADNNLAKNIATEIEKNLLNRDNVSVEEIQDMVETMLMSSERKDVAKRYILYRGNRNCGSGTKW